MAAVYMSMAGYPMNQTQYYTEAAKKAKEVIDGVNNGTYKHGLLNEWNQVFSFGNNHHEETLLGIDYNAKVGGWGDGDSQLAACHQLGSLKDGVTSCPNVSSGKTTRKVLAKTLCMPNSCSLLMVY